MSTAIQPSQPQQLQQAPRRAGSTLAELIASRRESFAQVATKHYDPDRLVKLAQAALSRNQKLAECTPPSVLLCLMKCAELGLEPDSALPQRRMWLVPRWNSKLRGMECTYQLDYRAQLQLARDTGMVSSIVASEVRERDEWAYELSPAGASMTTFSLRSRAGFASSISLRSASAVFAKSITLSEIGTMRICSGASQSGKLPA